LSPQELPEFFRHDRSGFGLAGGVGLAA